LYVRENLPIISSLLLLLLLFCNAVVWLLRKISEKQRKLRESYYLELLYIRMAFVIFSVLVFCCIISVSTFFNAVVWLVRKVFRKEEETAWKLGSFDQNFLEALSAL
jgi:ABC-type Fe3+ transport system permease subunit